MFLKKEIENLGLLTDEQKQNSCWTPGTISGSRVARIMTEPRQVLAEWLNDAPAIIENNPIVKEKMEIGTYMESVIVDLAKQKLGLDIKIDKNTYKAEGKPFYFNIDGISDDGKVVYEIKNTETTNIDILVERYKYQAIWYCLMTGCEKVVFIFFIRGYKLRTYEYTPEIVDKINVLEKCQTMIEAYNLGTSDAYDMITWGDDEPENNKPIEIQDQQARQLLSDLIAMQEDQKILDDKIKELKEYFGEALGEAGSYVDPETGNKISVVSSTRKGAVDVEETLKKNPGLVMEYKADYTYRTIKASKAKK